ncbi:MAG: hypothetical protein FJY29_09230 [Betaproteobacteria bacterium]|nr:hypothetical protein [Betaproteobacteria bacterium]
MKLSIAHIAFIFSACAHAVVIFYPGAGVSTFDGISASSRPTVTARIVVRQTSESIVVQSEGVSRRVPSLPDRLEPTASASVQTQPALARIETGQQQLESLAAENSTDVSKSLSTNGSPDRSQEASPKPDAALEVGLNQAFSMCRAVALPKNWIHRSNLFPRRYTLEFMIARKTEGVVFAVQKLTPDESELPYADRLIKRTFEDCMNQQGQETILALEERFRALNPEPTEAYSLKIEFDTPRAHAGQSKGI